MNAEADATMAARTMTDLYMVDGGVSMERNECCDVFGMEGGKDPSTCFPSPWLPRWYLRRYYYCLLSLFGLIMTVAVVVENCSLLLLL